MVLPNARGPVTLERKAPVGKGSLFGDLPFGLACDGGCILQCQGAASSLPETSAKLGSWHDLCEAKLLVSQASLMRSSMWMRGPSRYECCQPRDLVANCGFFSATRARPRLWTLFLQRRQVADEHINRSPDFLEDTDVKNTHSTISSYRPSGCQRGAVCVVLPSRVPLARGHQGN